MVAGAADGFLTKKTWWLVVVGLLFNTRTSIALAQGQECVNPAGKTGRCILFRECQPLLEIYNKRLSTPDDRSFLVSSRCGELDRKALVCCASVNDKPQTAKRTLPEAPNCGIQLSDRIVGGQETQLDEFPWSALIEYRKEDGSHDFHCGGTLINERYIVTAAHCVQSLPRGWMVYRVRLGEWDLASTTDCQGGICSPAPVNREVESVLAHPGYSSHDTNHYDDIALVRFTQNVHFSGTIRPICLPVSASLRTRFTDGASSYAAGWGKTEYASANLQKLKVELTIQHLQKCLPVYQRIGIALRSTQMCAGGVQGKDTCNGDSGGPLMGQARGAWYLLGVISFGLKNCGSAGVPGVYTNMAEYINWIRDNIY